MGSSPFPYEVQLHSMCRLKNRRRWVVERTNSATSVFDSKLQAYCVWHSADLVLETDCPSCVGRQHGFKRLKHRPIFIFIHSSYSSFAALLAMLNKEGHKSIRVELPRLTFMSETG